MQSSPPVAWIENARRLVAAIQEAVFAFKSNTRLHDLEVNSTVLVTQIVARALMTRGVPNVSVGVCLFQMNDKEPVAHSVLRIADLVVDLLPPTLGNRASTVPFAWSERSDEAWIEKASAKEKVKLNDSLEDLLDDLMFGKLLPYYDHQEKNLGKRLREVVEKSIDADGLANAFCSNLF